MKTITAIASFTSLAGVLYFIFTGSTSIETQMVIAIPFALHTLFSLMTANDSVKTILAMDKKFPEYDIADYIDRSVNITIATVVIIYVPIMGIALSGIYLLITGMSVIAKTYTGLMISKEVKRINKQQSEEQ